MWSLCRCGKVHVRSEECRGRPGTGRACAGRAGEGRLRVVELCPMHASMHAKHESCRGVVAAMRRIASTQHRVPPLNHPAHVFRRHFQKNTYLAAKAAKQQKAGAEGRDPFGLFKEAIVSESTAEFAPRLSEGERALQRAAYSRAKIIEVTRHFPARVQSPCPVVASPHSTGSARAAASSGECAPHQDDRGSRRGVRRTARSRLPWPRGGDAPHAAAPPPRVCSPPRLPTGALAPSPLKPFSAAASRAM